MKRSGFRRPTYEHALEQAQKSRARLRARIFEKTRPRAVYKQSSCNKARLENWKLAVRTRDDYQCQFPGCTIKDPHIDCHHIAPRSQRKDLIYVVSNGISLCRSHHDWIPNNVAKAIEIKLLSTRSRELATKEGTIGIF